MDGRELTVRCACGWEVTGPEDDVVEATSDHGQRLHNMSASREQILAMAVETPSTAPSPMPGASSGGPATGQVMPKPSPAAIERFKGALPEDPHVTTRPMFGNLAAFANGYMFAGLFGDDVFVRLDDDGQADVIENGGSPFAPMPGRPMRGYVVLPADRAGDDGRLRSALGASLAHTMALPPKEPKAKKPKPAR